jgi:superfamily II DNA helicase RecQ
MSSDQMSVSEVKSAMLDAFGFSNFKSPWQEKAVMKIHEGHKNVIVSLPTHGGKSLTFQIQSKFSYQLFRLMLLNNDYELF